LAQLREGLAKLIFGEHANTSTWKVKKLSRPKVLKRTRYATFI